MGGKVVIGERGREDQRLVTSTFGFIGRRIGETWDCYNVKRTEADVESDQPTTDIS